MSGFREGLGQGWRREGIRGTRTSDLEESRSLLRTLANNVASPLIPGKLVGSMALCSTCSAPLRISTHRTIDSAVASWSRTFVPVMGSPCSRASLTPLAAFTLLNPAGLPPASACAPCVQAVNGFEHLEMQTDGAGAAAPLYCWGAELSHREGCSGQQEL